MRLLVRLHRRLRLLFARDRVEREMAEEMESHLRLAAGELERAGLDPATARRRAEADFGHLERTREAARDARGGRLLDDTLADLRHTVRGLRRAPGHAAAVLGILATAITGAALAAELLSAYVFRPLPFPEAGRLMSVIAGPSRAFDPNGPDLSGVDWVPAERVFELTGAWDLDGFTLVQPDVPSEYVDGAWVSRGYFPLLGLAPAMGRPFAPDEYVPGSNVALISDAFWRRRFAGDTAVVGRTVRMHSTDRPEDDALVTIVGVLPPVAWELNRFTDVLRPLGTPRRMSLVRLPIGMTRAEGEQRLTELVRGQITVADPAWHMSLDATQAEYTLTIRPALRMLAAAALLLLILAEASVGALLLARATVRLREMAFRRVLGATRGRLVRQLATEALLVSGLAVALGLALALLLGRQAGAALERFGGVAVPGGLTAVRLDLRVIALVIVATMLPYLGLALAPMASLARVRPGEALTASRVAGGRRATRVRQLLATVQVAVSVALLTQGALLLRSVRTMRQADLGFAQAELLKAHLLLPRPRYPTAAARLGVIETLLARVAALPGVEGAAAVFPHPFRGNGFAPVECDGCGVADGVPATPQTVTPGYFATLGIPLRGGRLFDARDDSAAAPVAIVSEALARRFWGAADPVGRQVRLATAANDAPWLTVVGVVGEVRKTFSDSVYPDLYRPLAQQPRAYVALMVRSATPASLARPVADVLRDQDDALALSDVEPMSAVVADRRGQTSLLAGAVGAAGGLAFLLTIAGLYAVVRYLVRLRRREFAVRLALGAVPARIVATVLREARGIVALGVAAGLALAIGAGRLSRAWLMDLSPTDPATLAGVVLTVLGVILLALAAPAWDAARTPPSMALREE